MSTQELLPSELLRLVSAKSADEWNAVCSGIKARCDGYPTDWYAKVLASGVLADAQARFG